MRKIRAELRLTQRELAAYAGITQAAYSNIENGRRAPGLRTAMRMAEYLGVDWKCFFGEGAPDDDGAESGIVERGD